MRQIVDLLTSREQGRVQRLHTIAGALEPDYGSTVTLGSLKHSSVM